MFPGEVLVRVCDEAARILTAPGLPLYDELLLDAPKRMEQIKATFDHHVPRTAMKLRPVRAQKLKGILSTQPVFPIRPHAAAAADVLAGRALFHLHGQGRVAPIDLPAFGKLKSLPTGTRPRPAWDSVIVVQAEIDRRGRTILGIVTPHDFRVVERREVVDLRSWKQLREELARVRAKREAEED